MHRPFTLGQACSFHVMHKEVDPLERNEAVLEPADADHLYSAKVGCSTNYSTCHDSRMAHDIISINGYAHGAQLTQDCGGTS